MSKLYIPPHYHTEDELVKAWRLDLLSDAEHAEKLAKTDRARAPELLAYAATCRAGAAEAEVSLRRELGAYSNLTKKP